MYVPSEMVGEIPVLPARQRRYSKLADIDETRLYGTLHTAGTHWNEL